MLGRGTVGNVFVLVAMAIVLMAVPPAQAGWSRPTLIADGQAWGPQVTAVSGRATVTWSNTGAGTLWTRQIHDRRTLSPPGAHDLQLFSNDRGDALALWRTESETMARLIDRNDRLGPARRIASDQYGALEAVVDSRGTTTIAWDQSLSQVATGPDGVTTAVWYRLVSLEYRFIQAARFTPKR